MFQFERNYIRADCDIQYFIDSRHMGEKAVINQTVHRLFPLIIVTQVQYKDDFKNVVLFSDIEIYIISIFLCI